MTLLKQIFFHKDEILKNMIVGTPSDVLEQILELKKQVPITTLSLKLLTSDFNTSKHTLKLYATHILPKLR